MNHTWTFGKKVAAGFLISSILLVAIGAIAHQAIDELIQTSYWVTHTHQVMEKVANALSSMKDAETGQRGYLLTGEESYLEPFNSVRDTVITSIRDLRELTADNPEQQRRIDEAEKLINAKFAELKQTIDLRKQGQQEQALKVVAAGVGKRTLDELRLVLAEMDRGERDLRKQRAAQSDATAIRARQSILYGSLLCLAFVTIAGVYLTRTLNSAVREVHTGKSEVMSNAKTSRQLGNYGIFEMRSLIGNPNTRKP